MLVQIVSKHVLDENATSSAKRAREIGLNQFDSFINDRRWNGTASLYDNIMKTNLPLFSSKNSVVILKSKQRIANLEADLRLYANLFVACQARYGNLDNFAHENHAYPVSLSEYGTLRKCSAKSAFLQCLNDIVKPSLSPPNVEVKIVDTSAFVNIIKTKTWKTFGQYFSEEIPWKVQQQLGDLKGLDLVSDTYKMGSIKKQTREGSGVGIRISVRTETPIGKKFRVFLKNNDNKTGLFKMLSINITKILQI